MVLRLAPHWFRIGSLEILARKSETKELNLLVDFILTNHFAHVKQENRDDWILAMFAGKMQFLFIILWAKNTLFRNKRFALNEVFQRNASKFAIFYSI